MQRIRSAAGGIKTFLIAMTAVSVVTTQTAQAQLPAALSQAPDGAHLVVIVPSMSELSGKLAILNQTLGLESAELTDALGAFKAQAGIADGLNDTGAALIVVQDLTGIFDQGEPDFVGVLPVTDFQIFVGNFEGVDTDSDLTFELTLPDGQQGYARESGGYAVVGHNLSLVQGYTPGGNADAIGGRIGELGLGYLSDCDAAVYIDLEALAPVLIQKIDEGLAEANQQMGKTAEMGMMDPSQLEMITAIMSLYGTAGKAILNSAEGLVVTLDISEHGVGITDAIQFKPDSPMMKYLPGGGDGTASILARLPKSSYILAGAIDNEAIAMADLFDAAIAALPKDNVQVQAQIEQYRKAMPLMRQLRQYAAVFYTPDPNAMATMSGVMNVLTTYNVQDSTVFLKDAREYITSLNGVSIPMTIPMADAEEAAMTYTTSYTDNALQLDGVQVDQYSIQMQMPPQMLDQMGPMAVMMQMFTHFNGYATENDGHYLFSSTLDQQQIAKALASGKAGDGIGTGDSLAEIREKAVPSGSVAEFYFNLGGAVETVGPMAAMFGMPAIQAPQDLPPIAFGLGIKGNSSAARFYVPNETTKFVIDTAKDIQAQMMGGQGQPGEQQQGQDAHLLTFGCVKDSELFA